LRFQIERSFYNWLFFKSAEWIPCWQFDRMNNYSGHLFHWCFWPRWESNPGLLDKLSDSCTHTTLPLWLPIVTYISTYFNSLQKIRLCIHVWMEYCDFKVFTCVLWQFTMKFAPLACVNWGNTPESGWIHLKVGTQSVLVLVGKSYKCV